MSVCSLCDGHHIAGEQKCDLARTVARIGGPSIKTLSLSNQTLLSPPPTLQSPTAQTPGAPPLQIMISGAPASGKGTQCEEIVKKVSPTGQDIFKYKSPLVIGYIRTCEQ